jgi:KUP system potassium uptake protein
MTAADLGLFRRFRYTDMQQQNGGLRSLAGSTIKALGLVFGDIGTSPIYTLTVIFFLTAKTPENVIGVLSLIFWTLFLLVMVEYAWLAMSLGKKGEGGTIVLRELLVPMLGPTRKAQVVTLLSYIGISLFAGDGVITPAISILSAVEGILLIPGLEGTPQNTLIAIASAIAITLFAVQSYGTEKVSKVFGPVMVLWFATLFLSGMLSVVDAPEVLKAFSPHYAGTFLLHNGLAGFFILSEVILCATGGEALYADMGHLGRAPIFRAWLLVFPALVTCYMGQGAYLTLHPDAKNVLFEMIFHESVLLYIPFLVLSIAATIIASQAMISGMFSIIYQSMSTRIMPLFKVEYTSSDLRSQIYIGLVNWALLASVLFIMFIFRESANLAVAYGLAVTGTMTITGIMMTWIFLLRGDRLKAGVAILVTVVDFAFLISNMYKIPHGGYWSLILASVPLSIILAYTTGQKRMYKMMKSMDLDIFLDKYWKICKRIARIQGTALFFARDMQKVSPYIYQTILTNNIVYTDNIVVSIVRLDDPFGISWAYRECYAEGLRQFEIMVGYMEVVDVGKVLKEAGIDAKAIFYGMEEITTKNPIWKFFALIKRVTPSYIHFYKLPPDRLHGIITRLEM